MFNICILFFPLVLCFVLGKSWMNELRYLTFRHWYHNHFNLICNLMQCIEYIFDFSQRSKELINRGNIITKSYIKKYDHLSIYLINFKQWYLKSLLKSNFGKQQKTPISRCMILYLMNLILKLFSLLTSSSTTQTLSMIRRSVWAFVHVQKL